MRRDAILKTAIALAVSWSMASGNIETPSTREAPVILSGYPAPHYDDSGNFASHMVFVGYLRIGSEEFVTILDKRTNETLFVSKDANVQGISLVSTEPATTVLKGAARIRKGDQVALVRNDSSSNVSYESSPQTQSDAAPKIGATIPANLDPSQKSAYVLTHYEHRILRPTPVSPPVAGQNN